MRKAGKAVSALLKANLDIQTRKRPAIALSRIYAYLRAAHKQARAIESLELNADPKKPSYSTTMIQAFIHAHLYFICWAAIGRMLEVIRRCSRLEAPNKVWKKYRAELEQFTDARDHFEHYEERLPGGRESVDLVNPDDYGSLHHGWFSLGGYRWGVSKKSIKKLQNIVAELDENIRSEASERLKEPVKSLSANRPHHSSRYFTCEQKDSVGDS